MRNRAIVMKIATVALLGVVLVSHHPYADDSAVDAIFELLAYLLLGTAAMGRVWCSAYISGNKRTQLVVSGPYSVVRNPLYFFSFLGFLGAGLAFESVTVAALFCAIFILTHWPAIRAEEQRLAEEYGAQFADYCTSVPRFFPRTWRTFQPDRVTFSPDRFNRAVLDCSLILGVFLVAHALEWAHLQGHIPVLLKLP